MAWAKDDGLPKALGFLGYVKGFLFKEGARPKNLVAEARKKM
jgi:hypothetical protein